MTISACRKLKRQWCAKACRRLMARRLKLLLCRPKLVNSICARRGSRHPNRLRASRMMMRMSGWFYLVSALALGLGFCGYAFALWRNYSDALARRTFRFSLIHLSLLFAALLIDHYLPW